MMSIQKQTRLAATVLAALLFWVGSLHAEGISERLTNLRTILNDSITKIDVRYIDVVEKCRNNYAAALATAEDEATRKGDLDGVIKIRKEITRFSHDRAVDDEIKPDTIPAIKKATEAFLKELETAENSRAKQVQDLSSKYLLHLDNLKKKLTTERNIEDALVVQKEIKRATSRPFGKEAGLKVSSSAKDATCKACQGNGKIKAECKDCGGTGTCTYCKGTGQREGLGGRGVTCFACSGSGKCKKCYGTGTTTSNCSECNGTGRISE